MRHIVPYVSRILSIWSGRRAQPDICRMRSNPQKLTSISTYLASESRASCITRSCSDVGLPFT